MIPGCPSLRHSPPTPQRCHTVPFLGYQGSPQPCAELALQSGTPSYKGNAYCLPRGQRWMGEVRGGLLSQWSPQIRAGLGSR